jgi:hypothetical protein
MMILIHLQYQRHQKQNITINSYSSYTYTGEGEQQEYYLAKDSFKQAHIDMLKEETEKLFTSLEKMLIDESIDHYVSNIITIIPGVTSR